MDGGGATVAGGELEASDLAFLAPELVSEVDGPVRAPERVEGRLGYRFVKRAFDIVFSLGVIFTCVLLWPVILIVCTVVVSQCKASPIYSQKRVGKDGVPFGCLKLRTMVRDAEDVERYLSSEQLEQWRRERKVDGDPRITSLGRVMRRTSLDEVPQFLNVLAGHMSVIGPRPVVEDELANFDESERAEVLSMRPGLTGWWQVSARNGATWDDGSRQELELFYVRNASFAMDVKVFIGTFGAMFGKRTGK